MKKFLKIQLSYISTFCTKVSNQKIKLKRSLIFRVRFNVGKNNFANFRECKLQNTFIKVTGTSNNIDANGAIISGCRVNISGIQNKFILEKGVKLRNATIHIRGNNCNIHIGANSTIGGIRIVNAGNNNNIVIGSNCMFSDNIEVWASDTHKIFNRDGLLINTEKSIIIEDNVWIGSHVKILKGITIGGNSVIGMGSTVTHNVEKSTLNVGSPAKQIKRDIYWER